MLSRGADEAREAPLFVALGVVGTLASAILLRAYVTDDTFIHCVFARNLHLTHQFAFNAGEPVYGDTSPLWVAMLAVGGWLHADYLVAAKTIACLSGFLLLPVCVLWARRAGLSRAETALAVCLVGLDASLARWSSSGMETIPACVAVLTALVLVDGATSVPRATAAGVMLGVAFLLRPEAIALAAFGVVWMLVRGRPPAALTTLAALAAAILPWLVYAHRAFGALTPTTSSAKSSGLIAVPGQIWRDALAEGRVLVATEVAALLAIALALALPPARRDLASRVGRGTLPLAVLWAVAVLAGYAVLGYEIVSRYIALVLPVVAVAGAAAAGALSRRAKQPALVFAAVAALSLAQNALVTERLTYPQVRSFTRGMHRSLIPAARWLAANSAPDAVVATQDIGAMGYYSRRRVLDLGGLVTPAITPLRRTLGDDLLIATGAFFQAGEADFVFVRGPRSEKLDRAPFAGRRLERVFAVDMPNLGVTRPDVARYTMYRVTGPRNLSTPASGAITPQG